MAKQARLLPRSWVSGTRRGRTLGWLLAATLCLGYVVKMRDTGTENGGGMLSQNSDGELPPWEVRGRSGGVAQHAKVLAERARANAEDQHANEMELDPDNHLQNAHLHDHTGAPRDVAIEDHVVESKAADPAAAATAEDGKEEHTGKDVIVFETLPGKSCQNYAEDPPVVRDLEMSKLICLEHEMCNAIECPHGRTTEGCTLRALANGIDYPPADCYIKVDPENERAKVHPAYASLLKEYPYQPVTTQTGQRVNIILVRSPFGASGNAKRERELYEQYKDDILFMGISSFEDYPLDARNPFSPRIDEEYFLGAFPAFLHMMHHPERHFPPHIKTILMSQSDFDLPNPRPETLNAPKKYDFTYAATWPLGPQPDSTCDGWSGYCKNWSFVKEALHVLCGERNLTGVLVATRDKDNSDIACEIPASCDGKITQTTFINQAVYFDYLKHSKFAFVPQMHDASPRVSTQALIHDVPLLMNRHISGGWKYITEQTGEFFHDMSDFRESLDKILLGASTPGHYTPREWVMAHYGNENSGKRLLDFVKENFADRVHLPKHTKKLLT